MKYKIIIILQFLGFLSLLSAQKSAQESRADKYYNRLAYKKAVEFYKASERLTVPGLKKLADAYRLIGDYSNAEQYFTKYMEQGEFSEEDIYTYFMVLKYAGKYGESEKWLKEYSYRYPDDLRVKEYLKNDQAVIALVKDVQRYKIVNLDINSAHQDFGTSYFGKKIIYSSSLEVGVHPIKRSYSWNEKPFLDLFAAEVSESGQLSSAQTLNEIQKRVVNKKYHDGPACFALNGSLMAMTKNNMSGKSRNGEVKLQIFFSEFKDGIWQKETPFKLNNAEYSVAHPWLSEDGNIMYFVSDMPGGFGGTDIYRIEKKSGREWGEPVNMGEKINTEGNEMFPFFEDANDYLFFSSDGHNGVGGLDIYMAAMKNYSVRKLTNMGATLNSRFDDFALIVDKDMKKGYFSSNREGGKGDDDIYYFEILKPFRFTKTVKGKITDEKGNILAGNEIQLLSDDGVLFAGTISADDGTFSFSVDTEDSLYFVQASKDKYENGKSAPINLAAFDAEEISTTLILNRIPEFRFVCRVLNSSDKEPLSGVKLKILDKSTQKTQIHETIWSGEFSSMLEGYKMNQNLSFEITFDKEGFQSKTLNFNRVLTVEGDQIFNASLDSVIVEKFETGIDIAKVINLKPIYFGEGSSTLNAESTQILEQIVKVLNENPTMIIEINAHTDCRGSYNSNMALSDSRAKSCATYISSRISNPLRISGKGFGETKLVNNCSCEGTEMSRCSEKEHEQNRRTEFIIVRM
jgi:outer membrane protein OmpA-like peptidoglycan-associated protein/tetratricopeptide (TPR) repeat protein